MWFFCKILQKNASFTSCHLTILSRNVLVIGRNSQTIATQREKYLIGIFALCSQCFSKDLTLTLIIRRKRVDFLERRKTANGKRQILLFPLCLIFRNPLLIDGGMWMLQCREHKILWEDRQAHKSQRVRRGFGKEMDLSNSYQVCKHVQNIPDCP